MIVDASSKTNPGALTCEPSSPSSGPGGHFPSLGHQGSSRTLAIESPIRSDRRPIGAHHGRFHPQNWTADLEGRLDLGIRPIGRKNSLTGYSTMVFSQLFA